MTFVPEYLDAIGDVLPDATEAINENLRRIESAVESIESGQPPFMVRYVVSSRVALQNCLEADDGTLALVHTSTTPYRCLLYTAMSSAGAADDYSVIAAGDIKWVLSGYATARWERNIDPGISDDAVAGYAVSDLWCNGSKVFVCSSASQNNAVWHRLLSLGSDSGTACAGDDSRLSNSRTPNSHASSHITGDAIQSATSQQNGLATSNHISKLDGIESGADVTDAQNVASSGAIMDGDFSQNGLMTRTGEGTYSVIAVGNSQGTVAAGDDTRFPSTDIMAALAGTSGTPSGTNKFVTNSDTRLTPVQGMVAHGSTYHTGTIGTESEITFDKDTGHNHEGTGSRKVAHGSLTDIGSNTHEQVDTHLGASAPHSGHATTGDLLSHTGAAAPHSGHALTADIQNPVRLVNDGRLELASPISLKWDGYVIGLYDSANSKWVAVTPSSTPTMSNYVDPIGTQTVLAQGNIYDVFAEYVSATQFNLVAAPWYSASLRAGAWGSGTAYAVGDRVTRATTYWVCIQACTNQDPYTTTGYWVDCGADTKYPGLYKFQGRYVHSPDAAGLKRLYLGMIRPFCTMLSVSSWSNSTTYGVGDRCTSGGHTYISLQDGNLNYAVSYTNWWQDTGAVYDGRGVLRDVRHARMVKNHYNKKVKAFGKANTYTVAKYEQIQATAWASWMANGDDWKFEGLFDGNEVVDIESMCEVCTVNCTNPVQAGISIDSKTTLVTGNNRMAGPYNNGVGTNINAPLLTGVLTNPGDIPQVYHYFYPVVKLYASNTANYVIYWGSNGTVQGWIARSEVWGWFEG